MLQFALFPRLTVFWVLLKSVAMHARFRLADRINLNHIYLCSVYVCLIWGRVV